NARIQHLAKAQLRAPTEMSRNRIYTIHDETDQRALAREMVDDHDLAAGAADADHLVEHALGVWDYGDDVEGGHEVEGLVGECEVQRVALLELDVPVTAVHLLRGLVEHVL